MWRQRQCDRRELLHGVGREEERVVDRGDRDVGEAWQRLAELDPADARLQDRLLYAYSRVGMTHMALNRPADALPAYQDAARVGGALLLKQPNHPQFMSNVAIAGTGVGDAASALGRTAEACAGWREASGVYAALDRDGRLRADERKTFESVQQRLGSCAR